MVHFNGMECPIPQLQQRPFQCGEDAVVFWEVFRSWQHGSNSMSDALADYWRMIKTCSKVQSFQRSFPTECHSWFLCCFSKAYPRLPFALNSKHSDRASLCLAPWASSEASRCSVLQLWRFQSSAGSPGVCCEWFLGSFGCDMLWRFILIRHSVL